MDEKKLLTDLISESSISILGKQVLKNRKNDDGIITYQEFDWKEGDAEYRIIPKHIPIKDAFKWASGSCKNCNSKGYLILRIEKNKIKSPEDFIIMSEKSLDNMTEEQKEILIKEEAKKSYWRVMLPCGCALKRMQRKTPDMLCTDLGHILVKLEYEVK